MIARGEHLQAMQAHGLRYETPFADERLTIPVVGYPGEVDLRPDDVFLMTMKSQHTSEAFEELRWVHGDGVCVVCCQNGVANERMALCRFASVYAMLVYVPAQLIEPGRIQCHARLKSGVLDLDRFPGGSDDRAGAIAQGLEAANFSVRADPSVMRFKYAKLLMNLNNALEAIAPKGDLAKEISAAMKAEGLACFEAAGIEFAGDAEVRGRRKGIFEFGEIPGVERIGGSSRQSLLRATGDIEADYLNGEIVLLGRMHAWGAYPGQ